MLSQLVQQLCAGQLPWEPDIAAVDADQLSFPLLKKRMRLNAPKIRAASEELELVEFEFGNLHNTYASSVDAIAQAMASNQEQQDNCSALQRQLRSAAAEPGLQSASLSQQLRLLGGQLVMLQRRLEHFHSLQALAVQLHGKCMASAGADGAGLSQAAAAAAAAHILQDDDADPDNSDDDPDDGAQFEEESGSAAAGAGAVPTAGLSGPTSAAGAAAASLVTSATASAAAPPAASTAPSARAPNAPPAAAVDAASGEPMAPGLPVGDSHQVGQPHL